MGAFDWAQNLEDTPLFQPLPAQEQQVEAGRGACSSNESLELAVSTIATEL